MSRVRCRVDTAADWASTNPVLALGEWGAESDLLPADVKAKLGDGVTAWNSLGYAIDTTASGGGGGAWGTITGTLADQADLQSSLDAKADLVGGVVPSAQIPAIAITEYLGSVASQAAMLALSGQKGDWAVRSDLGTTWVITGNDPTQLADWTQLGYPTAPVTSVNGQAGVVVLGAADVGADASGSAAAAQAFAIQRGNHTGTQAASTISDFAATVRGTVLTGLSLLSSADVAASDTVLEALGKLQAQSTAQASSISGKQDALGLAANTFYARSSAGAAANKTISDDALAFVAAANNAAMRTALGATTLGGNLYTLTNPGAITFLRVNADNTVTARSAADLRTDLSLGTAATQNTGTSGANVPLLNGANTWTASQTMSDAVVLSATIGAATPKGFAFAGDLDTGVAYVSANSYDFVANGAKVAGVSQAIFDHYNGSTVQWRFSNAGLYGISSSILQWSASTVTVSVDTGLCRNAAGVVEVNNGTAGTYRDLWARVVAATSDGTTSACAFSRSSNLNTGLYFPGSNQVAGVANGVTAWLASSSSFQSSLPLTFAGSNTFIQSNAANSVVFAGTATAITTGAVTSRTEFNKAVASIANNSATAVLTFTIPNAAHTASFFVQLTGIIGAGGAIGAHEAASTATYQVTITRTAGLAAVANAATVVAGGAANVAGGTTVTTSAAMSAMSGANSATQTCTLNVTIARAGGSSANHMCLIYCMLMNANTSGITVA